MAAPALGQSQIRRAPSQEVDPVRYDTWKTSCGTRTCKGSESLHKILLSGDDSDVSTNGLAKLVDGESEDKPEQAAETLTNNMHV